MTDSSGLGQTGNTTAGGMEGRVKAADRFRNGDTDTTSETPPSPNYLTWLHTTAPTREWNDVHHRIGDQPWDAASGTHQHKGGDGSSPLFDADEVITGDLSTMLGLEQAVRGILIALARRGLTDSTT